MQRNQRIREVSQRQRAFPFDPPHRLPGARQELPRHLMVVSREVGFGGDEFASGAVFQRLPTGGGAFREFPQAAINDGQFTRIRTDGDGRTLAAGLADKALFVMGSATEIKSIAGLQLPQGMPQRLPRCWLRSCRPIIPARRVDEPLGADGQIAHCRRRQRPHRRVRAVFRRVFRRGKTACGEN